MKVEGQTEGIKVKVSKIPKGQMTKAMASALGNKHTEALEQSVKQELEKAGFGNGGELLLYDPSSGKTGLNAFA